MSLRRLATNSSLMVVDIDFNGQKISFDLGLELEIKADDPRLNKKLAEIPRNYAFLMMVLKKLTIEYKRLERRTKSIKAKRLRILREECSTVKEAEILIESDEVYNRAFKKQLKVEEYKDIIDAAVRSYEMRKDLIQTLSANERNERSNT